MVVFIDDLDRCGDERIMQVLQTINLVLGSCEFFVFLAIDTQKIYDAVAKQRPDAREPRGSELSFPEQYLRKILQLSFHLPGTGSQNRFTLVEGLFSPLARREHYAADSTGTQAQPAAHLAQGPFAFDLATVRPTGTPSVLSLPDTGTELGTYSRFQEFLPDNAREVKRLVNVHRFVKIMVKEGADIATVEGQEKLTEWLIFCARWPGFVDDVLSGITKAAPRADALDVLLQSGELTDEDVEQITAFRRVEGYRWLPAEELLPRTPLARAAHLSQMIRDQVPASRQAPEADTPTSGEASGQPGAEPTSEEPLAEANGPTASGDGQSKSSAKKTARSRRATTSKATARKKVERRTKK